MLRLRTVLAVVNCDDWLASCLSACNDAPVPLECRGNCRFADRQCLDACDAD
jgi:hypothetical protein